MSTHKYPVGARVVYTNDYGVVFPARTIIKLETGDWWHDPSPKYYLSPMGAWWCPVPERNLTLDERYIDLGAPVYQKC